MITNSQYVKIQRMHLRDNISINGICRKTSLSRNTVRKWLRAESGPEVQVRKTTRKKLLAPFESWLHQELEADLIRPIRNRHTALELHAEMQRGGYAGCYSRVTEFVRNWRMQRERDIAKPRPCEDKQRWMNWLYSIEQPHRLPPDLEISAGIHKIYDFLNPSPNSPRTRAMVTLAKIAGFSHSQIAKHLAISSHTVRGYLAEFKSGGEGKLFSGKSRQKKSQDPELKKCIFALLHEPPSSHGVNRTTWRLVDLRDALTKSGCSVNTEVIRTIIKEAGYRWKSAKVVLTSTDPEYREKYQHIQDILSTLKDDERFFSIDEFGPFAVKMKAGRVLVEAGVHPTVPQWQKSKGWLILTAALELSRNQVTHFYSRAKNTDEMIRMTDALVKQYADASKLYISWDAASWHMSKELKSHIKAHNEKAETKKLPLVELAPLPASAQFLNVIESVFSGMARAIIHSSDYESTKAAMDAIDRHFKERNLHFLDNPRRAGNKIWGMERTTSEFSASNNCKDPAYR